MKLLKIPFSAGGLGNTQGTELAPDEIVKELKEFYMNESGILPLFDVEDVKINQNNIEETNKNITAKVKEHRENKLAILGGDHSITYASFKAISDLENPGLLIFDAHPDCMQDFDPPTHEDFVKVLVNKGLLKKENLILVGLRNWHKDEYDFLKKNNIKYFQMKKISEESLHDITDSVMSIAKNFSHLYISIDIDVVDPAFAPGTGYPEPAGLTSRQLIYMLHRLKNLKNINIIDIVEVNPKKDINNMTSKLAAKILVELNVTN